MVLADVHLADLIWTTIWIFFLILFIWVFIIIISDLFRDHTLSGWAKAVWVVALIIFPLVGSLVYLIARGSSMQERAQKQAQQQDQAFRSYVQEAAGEGSSTADQLAKLADLRDRGVITAQEFESQKAKILA